MYLLESKSSEREERERSCTTIGNNPYSNGKRAGSLFLWSVWENIFQTQFPYETQVWTFR